MRVEVRFFATYRVIVGEPMLSWKLREGARLEDLVDSIVDAYPRLAGHRDTMLLAVNLAYANPPAQLHDGDEVALMPPVSGGRP